ncbi:MAG: NAD(P)H-hydrate dehydratase [Bryobacteraceae bacterium]
MKVLTAAQMRDVDRRTVEAGIPEIVLMENAGHRVVEFLEAKFAPLSSHRVVVICGKGNNGGDGLVVARQLHTRIHPRELHVVATGADHSMLDACGLAVSPTVTGDMRGATIVVDALIGTGLRGAARDEALALIGEINSGFPNARIVAVDIPSGMSSDAASSEGETVHADFTVTFTAPKVAHVLPPNCDSCGELEVAVIGSPPALYEDNDEIWLHLAAPRRFARLFAPRAPAAHKGDFGHVLVIAGSRGKTGAAAMTGIAALRAGAGLVTVASAESAIPVIASHAPELMTEPLTETAGGAISLAALDRVRALARGKTILAMGPGLGTDAETVELVRRIAGAIAIPIVIDADALNALAGAEWRGRAEMVLTPHPGEMRRLSAGAEDRVAVARDFALTRKVTLVLKGRRTLTAFSDGRVWVNPTGSAAMATGGTGDILTGLIAGLAAQFPGERDLAVLAGVWLHGRAGEMGASAFGEKALLATDLLDYLPRAVGDLL